VGVAVLLLLLVAGLAFANSLSVTRVTNNAASLHWANASVGTAALTRAGLVQAVTFAELEDAGLVPVSDFDFAMEQVEASAAELMDLLEIGDDHASQSELAEFLDQVGLTVDKLPAGEVSAAMDLVRTDVEIAYLELSESLHQEQDSIQAAIADNAEAGRALNGWVVFFLTLGVPGSAIAVYFVVARRQVRDVRARAKLELEAERTINRAKDSFIAGLSHELRTPLTSIYGFADMLADGAIKGHEATAETARVISNEAAEMTRLVDDLLAASRLDTTGIAIEATPTRINDVIESAITPFEKAGSHVDRIETDVVATVDAARLRHVMVNLISNAIRHGGPMIGVEVTAGDGVVDIEVWDNGPGVPPDQEARLFQRFVHEGSEPLLAGSIGLGLAVASRLVSLMGGRLKYQRFAPKTYFVVSLPLGDRSEDTDSEEAEPVGSVTAKIRELAG
jgi:signal transduction histidine kinase